MRWRPVGTAVTVVLYMLAFQLVTHTRAETSADAAPGLPRHSTIVVFGDSITAPGTYGQMIQDHLDAVAPELDVTVYSRGKAGDTAEGAMRRVATELAPLFPSAGAAGPRRLVLINLGINDVGRYEVADYLRHYEALIDEIQRTGAAAGIVSPLYPDKPAENPKLAAMVAGLKEMANRRKLLYVPVYEELKALRAALPGYAFYALDGSHPNAMGHAVFARTILTALGIPPDTKPRAVQVLKRDAFKKEPETAESGPSGHVLKITSPFPLVVTFKPYSAPAAAARRAEKPVALDGSLDEWNLSNPLVLNSPAQRVLGVIHWRTEKPLVECWASYSPGTVAEGGALYFAVRIRDDKVYAPAGSRAMERDCVEIFLDFRDQTELAAAAAKDHKAHHFLSKKIPRVTQFILPAPSTDGAAPEAATGTGDATMLAGTRMAARATAEGYVVEFSVPASHTAVGRLSPGTELGFDFSINDLDTSSAFPTATQLRWTGSPRTPFTTDSWGKLRLE